MRTIGSLIVGGLLMLGCAEPPRHLRLLPEERVVGRIRESDRVRLLTTEARLVTFERRSGTITVREIRGLARNEDPWGLAPAGRNRAYTLLDAEVLGEVDDDGQIVRRVRLPQPSVGLFSLGQEVLLQPASVRPGDQLLRRINLSGLDFTTVGTLRADQFDTRSERLTLNLVNCGSTQIDELPCWFNQDARVHRVRLIGSGRIVDLVGVGLAPHASRSLEHLETPGPALDGHIDASGRLWVLVGRSRDRGSWTFVIARYLEGGRLDAVRVVSARPRLILDVAGDECTLLTGTGSLTQVALS